MLYTRRALAEIEHLQDYIASDNPSAAEKIADTIRTRIGTLTDHPELGRRGRRRGTRELIVAGTSYIVAYRLDGANVVILAIVHAAQRWPDRL
jgi:addiction module RelE/StbE family toxin